MYVMEAFDIGRESAAIYLTDFDLVKAQACLFCFIRWYNHTAI